MGSRPGRCPSRLVLILGQALTQHLRTHKSNHSLCGCKAPARAATPARATTDWHSPHRACAQTAPHTLLSSRGPPGSPSGRPAWTTGKHVVSLLPPPGRLSTLAAGPNPQAACQNHGTRCARRLCVTGRMREDTRALFFFFLKDPRPQNERGNTMQTLQTLKG